MNATMIQTKQVRGLEIFEKLYEFMPVGNDVPTSVQAMANKFGFTYSQMSGAIQDFERAGILSRRETWSKHGKGGKQAFWTLLKSKEDGLSTLTDYQSQALDNFQNNPSLKLRILEAIKNKGKYDSVLDILNDIRKPNENIDLHNITHCMYSLRTQGKITFKTKGGGSGKLRISNDKIPVGITYTAKEKTVNEQAIVDSSSPEPIAEVEAPTPEPEITPIPVYYVQPTQDFPMIRQLIQRKANLEHAASLAEDAGEVDMALSLLEKAQANESPFNQEVIALWNSYLECLNK